MTTEANGNADLPFRVQAMADHGLLFTFGDRIDAVLSLRIARLTNALAGETIAGVVDYVPSYTTLLVLIAPGAVDVPGFVARANHHWRRIAGSPAIREGGREVVIPVVYGGEAGPDLADVARTTGLPPDEVIARHAGGSYQVGAIGFSPGFAFLIGLPPELAVPRRFPPRTAVPPGSVGIGGAQTGIYSLSTPGGWSLIGRTSLRLFDPEREQPSLLEVGDTVLFEPVTSESVELRTGPQRRAADPTLCSGQALEPARVGLRTWRLPRARAWGPPASNWSARRIEQPPSTLYGDALEVLEPGLQTSVQDLGRNGYGRLGIAPGGALDRAALVQGNRLLGNPDGVAGLEITLTGPRLRFLRPGRIALTGADLGAWLNGMRMPPGAVRVVGPGDVLHFEPGKGKGARAWLCIAGGIDVPVRLGSRATDLTAGFGGHDGRALRVGDRLRGSLRHTVGEDLVSSRGTGKSMASVPWLPAFIKSRPFRVVPGPQAGRFDDSAWKTFLERDFTVSTQSNRLGIRLDGPAIPPAGGADIISEGLVTGAIQVTGEGQPIVMLPARATIGGYPKIATVVSTDLDRLGRLRPGDTICFEEVALPIPEG